MNLNPVLRQGANVTDKLIVYLVEFTIPFLIVYCLQVLGDKAYEKFGKWFISLHFSDQLAGSYKKVLMFKFVLPDANNMSEMTRLVALIPYYIDLVGRYKLSSHVSIFLPSKNHSQLHCLMLRIRGSGPLEN